jgi:Zn-dependent peptidase ImmA (M78 family)/phosphopantetheine adenylyltransferase
MNSFVKSLIQPLLEQEGQNIALVPGGFKPPTIGHFALVDEVSKNPNIDKVIVLIGHKNRDGVSKEESKEVWDLYKKYLPSNIEIQISENPSPISDVASLIKNNPQNTYHPVVGIRGEMDLGDLKRFDSLEGKYPNFKIIVIKSEQEDDRVSGTNTRAALIGGEKERFQSYLPTQLSSEEKNKVWSILTKTPIEEGTCGYTTDASTGKTLDTPGGIEEMYAEPSEFNYPSMIKSLTEYMLDKGMNIKPLPKVKFVNDDAENAQNFFGKTAYYNSNKKVIVLYTMGRHPKDVMRSFAHEMIHHMQNCDGRLQNITTQNTNEEGDLPEIEREAYEKGNMMFRNWTDTITEGIIKEESDNDILAYSSTFKPDTNILVVFEENENYPNLKPLFDEYGYGFYYPKDKTIIINGENFVNSDLDLNDLKFVEAHEVTHLLLGHTGPYSEDDEMDADLGAYILLKNKGLSTDKLVKEFKNRHGVPFTEDLLQRVDSIKSLNENVDSEYVIYCDMDGVLCDFDLGYEKLTGISTAEANTKGKSYFWELFRKGAGKNEKDFWSNLPWQPGGRELWKAISPHTPNILSSPAIDFSLPPDQQLSPEYNQAIQGKKEWISKNLTNVGKEIFVPAVQKATFAAPNHILIDDLEKNITAWEANGGIGILHKNLPDTLKKLETLKLYNVR